MSRTVKSSAQEFSQCVPQSDKFVTVPQIEHVLVEQPVTYKQYKQKVTYMQVPVPETYTKVTLQSQEQGCQRPQQAYIPTTAESKPVYGCGAAPYEQASWDSTYEGVTDNGPFGQPQFNQLPLTPRDYGYMSTPAAPVYTPNVYTPRVNSYAALY